MKLWQGRFDAPEAADADAFNESLSFDKKLWRADITASVAHATHARDVRHSHRRGGRHHLCGAQGHLCGHRARDAPHRRDRGHSLLCRGRARRAHRQTGKKLHTARSRNDQVATDLRLYARDAADSAMALLKALSSALLVRAKESVKYVMPGFTHLRKAQPINCAQYFNAYSEMFLRDLDRYAALRKRMNVMPLAVPRSQALPGPSTAT